MPLPLRADFDAFQLRRAARQTKDAAQAHRQLALAAVYDGASHTDAAKIGGVTLQIVRDWVMKLNAAGPAGVIDRKAPGQPSRLNDRHRAALAAMIESGPIPAILGVVRWRIVDLCQWVWDELQVSVAQQTLSRELRAMGLRLAEIETAIAPGAHAVLLVDQGGWHLSHHLVVPHNIAIIPLSPKCQELNPAENVWQFRRATGCPTACSGHPKTSSTIVAKPGTSSPLSLGASCPSDYATGHAGSAQRVLVKFATHNF